MEQEDAKASDENAKASDESWRATDERTEIPKKINERSTRSPQGGMMKIENLYKCVPHGTCL